jgi:glycerol uptake facilitator protein
MNPYFAEFIGTTLLVLLGNGVVANVLLSRTKGHNGGWIVITAGWGIAVFVGAFCAAPASGAHLNPAVTTALALAGKFAASQVPGYLLAQMLGGIVAAPWSTCSTGRTSRFQTIRTASSPAFAPRRNIRSMPQSFFCEVVGTFVLILPIFLVTQASFQMPGVADPTEVPIGLGSLGLLPVALVVFGIGLSLGGTTGYAINPARDLGPRLAHAFLPIPGKRDSDWRYAWVPVLGPLVGALLAVLVYATCCH